MMVAAIVLLSGLLPDSTLGALARAQRLPELRELRWAPRLRPAAPEAAALAAQRARGAAATGGGGVLGRIREGVWRRALHARAWVSISGARRPRSQTHAQQPVSQ
jgi:hypothetical protein